MAALRARAHHIFAVQDLQDTAQELGAGLVVRLAAVVIQLPTQLIDEQGQEGISALCKGTRDRAEPQHGLGMDTSQECPAPEPI